VEVTIRQSQELVVEPELVAGPRVKIAEPEEG
jgi:hypothetical protein